MQDNKNKFQITAEDALKLALEKDAEEHQEDAYPVEFDEGVDFIGTGITIHNFGEIMGCCSESLMKLCEGNIEFKFSIWDAVRRFLSGDFGDVTPEDTTKAKRDYHEGFPVLCRYQNYFVGEGEILLGVDEAGHPENPRCIYVLLPSEQKAIEEWYNRHPEEKDNVDVPYAIFINFH